jgi:TPR repeat protein
MSACHLCGKAFEGEDAHTTRGRCGGCKRLRYCGVACQRSDWPAHKPQCKAWRAEADVEVVAAGGCPLGDVKAQGVAIQKWIESERTLASTRAAAEGGDIAAQFVLGECFRDGEGGASKNLALALSWYRRAASCNVAAAQLIFGQFHEQGVGGLTIDPAEGARLYALAAAQGLSGAQWRLGLCYERGQGVLKDAIEARRLYHLAAEQGDSDAKACLGCAYMSGSCGPQDFSLAMHWLCRAADKGHSIAEHDIGHLFRNGLGVPRDLHAAASWFSRAAARGFELAKTCLLELAVEGVPEATAALHRLGIDAPLSAADAAVVAEGRCPLGDLKAQRAVTAKWRKQPLAKLLAAAEAGDHGAQYSLGLRLYEGSGCAQDLAQALVWLRRSAAGNVAEAQSWLGLILFNGECGVSVDHNHAARLLKQSAEQGYAPAQYKFGSCLYNGTGTPRNPAKAVHVWRLAAEQGDAGAQDFLSTCYTTGEGTVRDDAAAVMWARRAADQGHASGMGNLGTLYCLGVGVPKDMRVGVSWLARSAEKGCEEAKLVLDKLAAEGVPEAVAAVRRLRL